MRDSNITFDTKANSLRGALRAARRYFAARVPRAGTGRFAIAALACALTFGILTPESAEAQVTPADSAGVLFGIAARLQAEGRTDLAMTLLRLVRERYPDTPAGLEAERLLADRGRNEHDQGGRTELIVFGTTYGVALGLGIPIALDARDEEAYGLGLLVGAPAGFLAARAYARSRSLSEGQASAIISGGTWGAWQAFGWREVLGVGEEEFCDNTPVEVGGPYCYENDPDADVIVGTMIAGSLVGLGVGTVLSQKNITRGTAATVNFGALWGSWFGAALAIAADQQDDALLSSILLGGNAGLLAGALGNPKWRLTEPRARLISIAGVGGLVAGFGLLLIAQPNDAENSAILVPLGGSIAGLALGARWTRHMEGEASLEIGRGKRLGLELPSVQPTWVLENGKRKAAVRLNLVQARF